METEVKTKVETLSQARAALAQIQSINSGGCGIAALALARWIKKSEMRATTHFVMGSHLRECFVANSTAQVDTAIQPDSCSHIGLIIYDFDENSQKIIDSRGLFDMGSYAYNTIVSREDILVKAINRVDRWNPSFKRRDNVPIIEQVLDIDLSDIDCRSHEQYTEEKESEAAQAEPKTATVELKSSAIWRMFM